MHVAEVDEEADPAGASVGDGDDAGSARGRVRPVAVEPRLLQERVGVAEARREGPDSLPDGYHPFVAPARQGQRVELRAREGWRQRRWGRERAEAEQIVPALGES